ncbi:fungal-specific transcription factor domain-containing protein [Bombardia bombarda]|uniref:Fungal-specific transcription factor domain-containing protein n=1 Tax=Bombardia bombarda TaxID=252184 RepID=A0AA40CG21_9PEZI|nr:fungal-specific transcription factor domain-containing protein [Bombardia bombarda]
MPPHSPPSPNAHPSKRPRQSSPEKDSPASVPSAGPISPTSDLLHDGLAGHPGGKVGQSSSFRNVSACNRCRLRKNRCDQKLPSCASCEKAGVACVGYDPITKREIPRSYIFYLESRVEQLEALLSSKNIPFPPSENLEYCSKPSNGSAAVRSPVDASYSSHSEVTDATGSTRLQTGEDETARLQRLVSKSSISGVPGAANHRYLGATSGVSFARVVFAAVQSSVSDQKSTSDKGGIRPYRPSADNGPAGPGTSMRDSFFGLHTKPTIRPAPFPDKALGTRLVTLYFEHANPQIPVLHKGGFMDMFEQAYAEEGQVRGPRELYVLNMVFAIGGGIILGDSAKADPLSDASTAGSREYQAEEYHASAIVHLEACLGSGGGLEELQAVLLLANFALLRPVGLGEAASQQSESHVRERGRREYVRDLRRRLWWCTYSFDRLVSVCVGRPFGISDQVITTEFPSLLEDQHITQNGLAELSPEMSGPTYKLVAHHYFRLRLLQSEILQVLQFQQTQIARAAGLNQRNPHMHTSLPSPFLSRFDSFRSWRIDIDKRLYEWKNSAPTNRDTGVAFSTEFFDLNYWQAIIMLYRQSLSVPAMFEGEYNTSKEVNSPTIYNMELREDEDRVYVKVAEAGQKILRLYRQLHRVGLVNYTYLATHHLFMAGISYLYAIWHSPIVRSRLTVDEVDFTILAAKSVFTDLIEKCPPAEACRDAFDRTAKATVRMANSTGGFGQELSGPSSNKRSDSRDSMDHRLDWSSRSDTGSLSGKMQHQQHHSHNKRHHRQSHDHGSGRGALQFDINDVYSNSPSSTSQLSAFQRPQYRMAPTVKSESDGFSLMRNLPPQPRSNASSSDAQVAMSPDTGAIDPSLMPSPTMGQQHHTPRQTPPAVQMGSPMTSLGGQGPGSFLSQPQQQQQQQQAGQIYSPGGTINFSDMQGMDFLQNLDGNGALGMEGDLNSGDNTMMDLGFGFGWEGLHHDFSDGQQVDLFDGFFFGGQQGQGGGAGGGGMGNSGSNGL